MHELDSQIKIIKKEIKNLQEENKILEENINNKEKIIESINNEQKDLYN